MLNLISKQMKTKVLAKEATYEEYLMMVNKTWLDIDSSIRDLLDRTQQGYLVKDNEGYSWFDVESFDRYHIKTEKDILIRVTNLSDGTLISVTSFDQWHQNGVKLRLMLHNNYGFELTRHGLISTNNIVSRSDIQKLVNEILNPNIIEVC